jgi:hypothetical protein
MRRIVSGNESQVTGMFKQSRLWVMSAISQIRFIHSTDPTMGRSQPALVSATWCCGLSCIHGTNSVALLIPTRGSHTSGMQVMRMETLYG